MPFLRKLYRDPAELKKACVRHLEFFNTHPYFSGIFAGILIHWESKNHELVSKVKVSYGGPMAALGTQMFWSTLRPVAGMAAILVAFAGASPAAVAVIFLAAYNVVSIPLRYIFLERAAAVGLDFFYHLKSANPGKLIWYAQLSGVAAASAAVFFYYINYLPDSLLMEHAFAAVTLATLLMHVFFKKISGLMIFYAVAVLSTVFFVMFNGRMM
jgi:mannose/fructose/N-acetylgalactosamine-specific phosphotransferase system component IID